MSAITTSLAGTPVAWKLPYRGRVGMACLISAESAIFTIFVVAYLYYVGKSFSGPTPREVLETPIFYTVCLLSSSLTSHFGDEPLNRAVCPCFIELTRSLRVLRWASSTPLVCIVLCPSLKCLRCR